MCLRASDPENPSWATKKKQQRTKPRVTGEEQSATSPAAAGHASSLAGAVAQLTELQRDRDRC